MKKSKYLQISSKTPGDKIVISGVFPLVDTHGLPLDMVAEYLNNKDMAVDWLDFYESAMKAGWTEVRALQHIYSAAEDVFGLEFRDNLEKRFMEYFKDGAR